MHQYRPQETWFFDGYKKFLEELECPLYMIEHIPRFPNSIPYPYKETKALYHKRAPYTSTFAWMISLAIQQPGLEELGLWGVDMAATEEYASQLAGGHYWLEKAEEKGIKITVPPESDLLRPYPEYGYQEVTHKYQKIQARAQELAGRMRQCEQNGDNYKMEVTYARGCKAERKFIRETELVSVPETNRDKDLVRIEAEAQQKWEASIMEKHFLQGAIDDMQYMKNRWPGIYEPPA